jgi:hypothetical protein
MAAAISESTVPQIGMQMPSPPFPEISQFSDSIVISLSASSGEPAAHDAFFDVLDHFCIIMLLNVFFVRGAITFGAMYHRRHIAFGPALLEAIEAEKQAKYPRVIVAEGRMTMPGVHLRISDDGLQHLDILRTALDRLADPTAIRNTIEERLRVHPAAADPKRHNKYVWFARYVNEVAVERNLPAIAGDLNLLPESFNALYYIKATPGA